MEFFKFFCSVFFSRSLIVFFKDKEINGENKINKVRYKEDVENLVVKKGCFVSWLTCWCIAADMVNLVGLEIIQEGKKIKKKRVKKKIGITSGRQASERPQKEHSTQQEITVSRLFGYAVPCPEGN